MGILSLYLDFTRVNVRGMLTMVVLQQEKHHDQTHVTFQPGYYNLNCFRFDVDIGRKKEDVIRFIYPTLNLGLQSMKPESEVKV